MSPSLAPRPASCGCLGDGRFKVDDAGGDLLLVYDASGGGDALFLQGAVVLQGVTDPDAVFVC